MSRKNECSINEHSILVKCIILITISRVFTAQTASAQFSSESYYDPELQDGGIPVLRNNQPQYQHNVAPGVGWSGDVNGGSNIDDDQKDLDDIRRANAPPTPKALKATEMKRRNSYVEPEDGLDEDDEEDRDEYQSGSRNHDSYTENPAFGESQKAAKDGDDIESFFDKHLGPQDALEGASSGGNNEQDAALNEARANIDRLAQSATDDPDEMYEAAASGPLATIIHSLLSLHKRPLVITTTDESPTSDKESGSSESSSASATSSSSTSSPSSIVSNLLGASSALQSSASSLPSGNSPDLTPIGYLSPLNTASYEPFGAQSAQAESSGSQEASGSDNEGGQVREIYIARRPSLFSSHHRLNHFQAYTPTTSQEKLQPQITPMAAVNWDQSSGAYGLRPAARPSLYSDGHLSDFSKYPVAASQNYNREPSSASSPQETTNSNDDEEQTVSFGLSFGGHPTDSSSSDDSSSPDSSTDSDEQTSANDDPPAYVPYNTRNLITRYPPKSSATSTDYNYPAIATSPEYLRVPKVGGHLLMRPFEQQSPFNGARYHRDPTETLVQQQPQTSHKQYRNSRPRSYSQQSSPQITGNNRFVTRQQLLANLDRQIKSNRYYQQQLPGHQAETEAPISRSVALRVQRVRPAQQTSASDYLDTYSSYHSEADPYKVLTTASRIVSEPVVDRTLQSGSNRIQSNVGFVEEPRMDGNISASSSDTMTTTTMINRSKPIWSVQLRGGEGKTKAQSNKQKDLLLTGLTVKPDALPATVDHHSQQIPNISGDLLRDNTMINNSVNSNGNTAAVGKSRTRVRRDDSDVGEDTDTDDDGVWVDDDEDDDNRQQSSDVNETSQDPEEEEDNQQDADTSREVQPVPYSASDMVGGPHGYELAPGDMML